MRQLVGISDRPEVQLETERRSYRRAVEIGVGVLLLTVVVVNGGFLLRVWMRATYDAVSALFPLLLVDGVPTLWTLAVSLARIGLAILPSIALLRLLPRRRWLWVIAPMTMIVVISTPLSLTACATADRWLLLVFLSVSATFLVRVRYLRLAVILPFFVLWEVVPRHGLLMFADIGTADPDYRARLFADCSSRRGDRPQNLTPDHLMPYHGINPVGGGFVFLGGEGPNDGGMRGRSGGRRVGSWWLHKTEDGTYRFEQPSSATGNLWRGCIVDGILWMPRARLLVGVRVPVAGQPLGDEVLHLDIPSADMDFLDATCDPQRGLVYVTEYLEQGVWEVDPRTGDTRRHYVGGGMLMPRWRPDGKLIITNNGWLSVIEPTEFRVVERRAVALASLSSGVCERDGSIAITDLTGRMRIFEIDESGNYRFSWGISLFAPRRAAFSEDCSRLAVTSADDRQLFVVDTAARRVIDVFAVGPALREVIATGPREFSASDVCSMTTYRW